VAQSINYLRVKQIQDSFPLKVTAKVTNNNNNDNLINGISNKNINNNNNNSCKDFSLKRLSND